MSFLFKQFIGFEGNIGSGKSAMIERLRSRCDIRNLPEPVERWENIHGVHLLENFYKKEPHSAFMLQTYIASTFIERDNPNRFFGERAPLNAPRRADPYIILDRTFGSAAPFIEIARQKGDLTPSEHLVLKSFRDNLKSRATRPNWSIYLDATPETCLARIQERNRPTEQSITLEYLRDLRIMQKLTPPTNTTFIIDANRSKNEVFNDILDLFRDPISRHVSYYSTNRVIFPLTNSDSDSD